MTTVLLLGESPPRGAPADFRPFDCASGTLLAGWLGLRSKADLLAHTDRDNCFARPTGIGHGTPEWDDAAAIAGAAAVIDRRRPALQTVIALGRRPADALGLPDKFPALLWARVGSLDAMHIPHPSGRSTSLTSDHRKDDARRALLPELVLGCPGLRAWHFRDDPAVLADLGACISPLRPALGVALCVVAGRMKDHHDKVTGASLDLMGPRGKVAESLAATATKRLTPFATASLRTLAGLARSPERLAAWLDDKTLVREVRVAERTAADAHEVKAYPTAVLRAIYARHVLLGVA